MAETGVLSSSGREMLRVAALTDLEPGKLKLFRAKAVPIALGLVDGQVRAVAARCTHAKVLLAPGKIGADGLIECPVHGAKFSPIDGSVKCAPATEPLAVYEVRIVGEDVYVDPGPDQDESANDITRPGGRPTAAQWGNWQ